MHVRMQSQENVEISNPMYMREEADEDAETMVPTFVMASDKVFHHFYIYIYFFVVVIFVQIKKKCPFVMICRPRILPIRFTSQSTVIQRRAARPMKRRKAFCRARLRIRWSCPRITH